MPTRPPSPSLFLVLGPPPEGLAAHHLHLARAIRERFRLDSSLFALSGRVIFADLGAARRLAEELSREVAASAPELALTLTPGRLFALGLVHELLHAVVERYREEVDPEVLQTALGWLADRLGPQRLEEALLTFAEEFPPLPVWQGEVTAEAFLEAETGGRSHRELLLEEMLLLWLAHSTPAFAPFRELFDDSRLRRETVYPEVMGGLEEFLATRPPVPGTEAAAGEERSLFAALQAPVTAEAETLTSLLAGLRQAPQAPLAPDMGLRALRGLDLLQEEERPVFPPGPGPVEAGIPAFAAEGPEAFTADRSWMPQAVLLAKNAFVWLGQLTRAYGRPVTRLDEIPEEELDLLAERGFTALWLIGLWERSAASQRIKRLTGNPEAAASAYSLAAYRIAPELGGEEALQGLKARAEARGIRLACDMVPNHFGIDSEWVLEHPERFLQLPRPPYPSYRFTGPDLSPRPEEVGLFLEDHYYDRSDAAVVFKRLDRRRGEVAYLYHGNDGTSLPWNDTAQLDYLQAEVREAITEVILEVARRFPIIRFDAAMTLARRHVRRLWYPAPGEGGAIPSRAEHGLPEALFDRAMPEEFWRQLVDRAAVEAPDTLLLAEAFWLMESYFVRTLGMHRVYNAAFMGMLRDEDNAGFRNHLKEVLAFDRRILERYVNFMSNPDERTAIDQFGDGEKYFAAATLLATLPGLPMFGHGQIEGFTERYGMEYRRAYREETPRAHLVARHEREVFPLLARRRLFAGSEHFQLYDFLTPSGGVDENVLAFSNRSGEERSLVVVNHRGGPTRGRIRRSLPVAVPVPGRDKPRLAWTTLGEALGLPGPPEAPTSFLSCRDATSNLEHLFDSRRLRAEGLTLDLAPFQRHVFVDFEAIPADEEGRWERLRRSLAGRGIPSLEEALLEPALQAFLEPFRRLLSAERLDRLPELSGDRHRRETFLAETAEGYRAFLASLQAHLEAEGWELAAEEDLAGQVARALERAFTLAGEASPKGIDEEGGDIGSVLGLLAEDPSRWALLYAWLLVRRLGELAVGPDPTATARSWLDDLLLGRQLKAAFLSLGLGEAEAQDALLFLKVLVSGHLPPLGEEAEPAQDSLEEATEVEVGTEEADPLAAWLAAPDVRLALRIHRHEGATYLHQESLEALLGWSLLALALEHGPAAPAVQAARAKALALAERAAVVGWRVEELLGGETQPGHSLQEEQHGIDD